MVIRISPLPSSPLLDRRYSVKRRAPGLDSEKVARRFWSPDLRKLVTNLDTWLAVDFHKFDNHIECFALLVLCQ